MDTAKAMEIIKAGLSALNGVSWNDRTALFNAVNQIEAALAAGQAADAELEALKKPQAQE